MAIEMLFGLNVLDDAAYDSYREAMKPILHRHGGGFGYDFKIAEVLKSPTEAPINRVFTIFFPDEVSMSSFFANNEYLKVKQRHFERSVADTTVIATYERMPNTSDIT